MAVRVMGACGVIALMGVLVSGCATDEGMGSSNAASGTSSGSGSAAATASSSTKNIDRVASGAVEDTLNACMARIPKDATAGQRMLAEESCRRDQALRR